MLTCSTHKVRRSEDGPLLGAAMASLSDEVTDAVAVEAKISHRSMAAEVTIALAGTIENENITCPQKSRKACVLRGASSLLEVSLLITCTCTNCST